MAADPPTRFTLATVASRDGTNGSRTWVVIKDNVYDVTEYLEEHPGGKELIDEYAGRDATKAFEDNGHSSDAKKTLSKYKIGELVEEDKKGNRTKKSGENNNETQTSQRGFLSIICCGCAT